MEKQTKKEKICIKSKKVHFLVKIKVEYFLRFLYNESKTFLAGKNIYPKGCTLCNKARIFLRAFIRKGRKGKLLGRFSPESRENFLAIEKEH